MPYRRRASYGRQGMRPVINSMKNVVGSSGGTSGSQVNKTIAKAVNSPQSAAASEEVVHGSIIKAIWIVLDICGLGGTGVLNVAEAYLFKNPGANLSPPSPTSVGTSNEKKFVIKQWFGMIMRNQDGNIPLHWEGWIKIPKRYQRMGTDDLWQVVLINSASITGHFSLQAIYKWYS